MGSDSRERNSSVAPVNSTVLEDIPTTKTDAVKQNKQLTMAEVVRNREWKENEPNLGWTEVRKRKLRNRFECRTGEAESGELEKFEASESKIPLFISNVNEETTDKDICDYTSIKRMTQEVGSLEKIRIKICKSYNAYYTNCF